MGASVLRDETIWTRTVASDDSRRLDFTGFLLDSVIPEQQKAR